MISWKPQGKKVFLILSVVFLSIGLIVKVDFNQSEKSSVNISVKDDNLRFDFDIQEKDKLKAENFSSRLGVSNSWTKGFEVGFDKASIEKAEKILPASLTLGFEDDKVTLSSKLKMKYGNERDFEISIEDPAIVLSESTKSASFRISSKLSPLFPIISKISKIDLKVQGKSIEGKIELK